MENLSIESLANIIYQNNRANGWWDKPREDGTLIALMHSELSEALEGARKGTMDDHLPQYTTVTVELADTIIRILDYCAHYELPIAEAIIAKIRYNKTRADHQRENREKSGGKKF